MLRNVEFCFANFAKYCDFFFAKFEQFVTFWKFDALWQPFAILSNDNVLQTLRYLAFLHLLRNVAFLCAMWQPFANYTQFSNFGKCCTMWNFVLQILQNTAFFFAKYEQIVTFCKSCALFAILYNRFLLQTLRYLAFLRMLRNVAFFAWGGNFLYILHNACARKMHSQHHKTLD